MSSNMNYTPLLVYKVLLVVSPKIHLHPMLADCGVIIVLL